MASTLAVAGVVTANAGVVVDNITIDGTEIDLSSGDLTLDVAGKIILSADDAGTIYIQDAATIYGVLEKSSSDFVIRSGESDGDIVFKGNDAGSGITALTLDMSAAGAATFNSEVFIPEKLSHTGDTDTHFKFAGANDIRIVAGNVEHAAFDGTIVFNQSGADMDIRVETTGNQNMLFIDSGNDVVNIGGTTSQTGDVLSIHGSGTNTVARMYNTNAGGDGSIFIFQKDSSSPADQDVLGDIRFQGNDDGGTMTQFSRIRGVSADVTNGTEDGEMHFEVVHNGTTREVLQLGSSIVFNEAGQDIDFRVESTGNANMLFVDGGNNLVGVGTSNPVAQFAVGAAGRRIEFDGGSVIRGFDRTASWAGIDFEASAYTFDCSTARMLDIAATGVIINEDGADADFRVESNGDTHCLFVDGGNNTVCFGASSPQQHARFFTTVGSSRPGYLTQNLTTGTTNNIAQFMSNGESVIGTINATNTATAYNTSSDYRLKENVETLKDGLDRLTQLKPVQFTWTTDGSLSEGFIAHEVDEVFSDAVSGEKDAVDDKGDIDPQQVDYGRITPLLVKAIQEQQTLIETLTTRIAALEGE